MRIYLSAFSERSLVSYLNYFKDAKINILISYALRQSHYYNLIKNYKDNINSLILDSGAYTKNKAKSEALKKSITFGGYKEFCKIFREDFDFAFNYDVNFDKDGFADNLYYLNQLRIEGLDPVPVVHDYINTESDYYLAGEFPITALGFSEDKKKTYFKPIIEKFNNAGKKVHLLGKSNYDDLYDIPIAYCDSSSWAQNQRFACISYWCKSKSANNKAETIHFRDMDVAKIKRKNWYDDYIYRDDLEEYLNENFGFRYYDLVDVDICREKRKIVNIHHFVTLQDIITKEHQLRGWNFST